MKEYIKVKHISKVVIILVVVLAIFSLVGFLNSQTQTPNQQQTPSESNGENKTSSGTVFSLVEFPELVTAVLTQESFSEKKDDNQEQTLSKNKTLSDFKKFTSEEDFKQYLASSDEQSSYRGSFGVSSSAKEMSLDIAVPGASLDSAVAPERVSETNVQVMGIDEPDIVKTNGTDIFVSGENRYYLKEPLIAPIVNGIRAPEDSSNSKNLTNIIKAFPPKELKEVGGIEEGGNLLLSGDNLVVFSQNKILGFDVSNTTSPKKEWTISLEDNTQYSQARLYNGKIYLVTSRYVDRYNPCPIRPFTVGGEKLEISCMDIYHPSVVAPVNVTYNVSTINPKTGSMDLGVSFVGSYDSTVYMSKGGLYVAYPYSVGSADFLVEFFMENEDLFSSEVMARLKKLQGYEISDSAKLVEIGLIIEELMQTMSSDEQLRVENDFENRMDSYAKLHKRDLEKTDIVKIDLSNFDIKNIGTVPGRLLNQFSLDEYDNNLRVAVTVGGSNSLSWRYGIDIEDVNDVYILNQNMKTIGSIIDLGVDERIYSARFIGERGYLVTFKQTDPFFVLDLSNPTKPKVTGELKIPGFSSYLHPISENIILGVGKEGSKVKLSLFDVSDPTSPKEVSKNILDEYWSEVQNTHHAFLQDSKHGIFFMPGEKGGYIFSYKNNNLKMVKAVSGLRARRAVYLDDYFYIIGDNEIIVLDESDWSRVNSLDF